ncbi:hypothetical protein [Bartonella sp. TP]|uniref:hypothetical protein n=1 Tax=Bartonella sp. TP TaxID=3057550 RepID=UPI0025B0F371|nr:hypothetical protein [Bartonella sp. TP]WJW80038.1 hypothetical protein QVL57_00265 [Bartonella sp. TP]
MARQTEIEKSNLNIERALEAALESKLKEKALEENETLEKDSLLELDNLANAIELSNIAHATSSTMEESKATTNLETNVEKFAFFPEQLKAANDDATAPSFYQIFKSRSASSLYWTTSAISLIWATGGTALAINLAKTAPSLFSFLNSAAGFGVVSGTIFPICAFWGFAKLSKNSSDLSLMIKSLSNTQLGNAPYLTENTVDFSKLSARLRAELTNMDGGIQRTYERACEIEAMVSGEVNNLERAYIENETRIHKLITMLANERQAILEHADRVKKTLQLTRNEISDELASVTDNITDNVETIAENLGKSLNKKTQTILDNLHAVSDSLTDVLTNKLDIKGDSYLGQLDNLFDKIDKTIAERGSLSANKFDTNMIELAHNTDRTVAEINEKFMSLDLSIAERNEQMLGAVQNRLDDMLIDVPDKLNDATKVAIRAFEENLESLNNVLTDENRSILTSFLDHTLSIEESTDKLAEILDTKARSLNEDLLSRITELENSFDQGKSRFLSTVEDVKDNLSTQVVNFENQLEQIFNDKSVAISAKLETSAGLISDLLAHTSDNLTSNIGSQLTVLTQHLDNIEQKFGERINQLNDFGVENIEKLTSYETGLKQEITQSLANLNNTISSYNTDIASSVANSLQLNKSEVHEVLEEQASAVEARIAKLRDFVAHAEEQFNELLLKQSASIDDVISYNNDNLQSSFNSHLVSLEEYANMIKAAIAQSNTLQTNFDEQKQHLEVALNSKAQLISEKTEALQASLANNLSNSFQQVEEQAAAVSRILHHEISHAAELFNQEASTAQQYVHKISDELTESISKFEQDFVTLHSNIVYGTELISDDVKAKIKEIEGYVETEAAQASQHIVAAGEYVNSALTQAMANVEQSLLDRSNVLNETVSKLETQISDQISHVEGSMQYLTERSTQHISSQLEQINNSSQSLYSASVSATHTFNNIAESLSDQITHSTQALQQQLSSENELFVNAVADRSAQIAQSVEKFTSELHRNIFALTAKLDSSSSNIVQKTEGLVENLQQAEDKFSQMMDYNNNNLNELSKDAKANIAQLTENFMAHANLLKQVSNLLDESKGSFSDKVGAHKDALQQLFKSLENKTEEMTKSIINYKNVIEAAEKVQDSNVSIAARKLSPEVARAANRFVEASQQIGSSNNELEAALAQNTQRLQQNYQRANTVSLKNAINEQIMALQDISGAVNNSALLDGTTGTSYNYQAKPSPTPESSKTLQELASTIIDTVDDEALAAVWHNYKKDQRNIDASKLYTAKGVLLFGHIRSKYRTEPVFKNSVDAYIAEFEKILKRLSAAGDSTGVYNYLQSDSGKIYTMLAHVTGRIE